MNITVQDLLKKLNERFNVVESNLSTTILNEFDSRSKLNNMIKKLDVENTFGVYIISEGESVIYIGSSGKVKRDKFGNTNPPKKGNGVGGRLIRSNTPYCFLIDYNLLGYKRKKKNERTKNHESKLKENYSNNDIELKELTIHVFKSNIILPTVLEHLFLQSFYFFEEKLPLINNQI